MKGVCRNCGDIIPVLHGRQLFCERCAASRENTELRSTRSKDRVRVIDLTGWAGKYAATPYDSPGLGKAPQENGSRIRRIDGDVSYAGVLHSTRPNRLQLPALPLDGHHPYCAAGFVPHDVTICRGFWGDL